MRVWLQSIRKLRGMSEQQVAAAAEISQPSYHYIETGERNPSVTTAQMIARTLGFDWTLFYPEPSRKAE